MRKQTLEYENADIRVNHIKQLYIETRNKGIPNMNDIIENNISELFWAGILTALEHRELINIAIRGKTGSSKSTTGCKILYIIIKKLQKLQKIPEMTEEQLQNYLYTRINSDQTEFLRFAMKEKGNTATLIDEFSTMGETGLNATTEQAMYTEHSDLFAQEAIHKISCSPSHINDKNADIILDFRGMDEKEKVSEFKLSFRDTTDYIPYALGKVRIHVGDIIEMPFYTRYRKKKFARLDLLKKHGIRNVKELEFAKIIKAIYEELKDYAYTRQTKNELILGVLEQKRREYKVQYSILTINYLVAQTKAILDTLTEIGKLQKEINKNGKDEITMSILKQTKEKLQKILLQIS